jgi:hypothetical protein
MHVEATMFDPFVANHPAVLVHEVDGPDFEEAWKRSGAEGGNPVCPICGEAGAKDRGVSPRTTRAWIQFSCGDLIAQEITAG